MIGRGQQDLGGAPLVWERGGVGSVTMRPVALARVDVEYKREPGSGTTNYPKLRKVHVVLTQEFPALAHARQTIRQILRDRHKDP